MKKLLIVLFAFLCIVGTNAQTTLLTKEQWTSVMGPTPFEPPKSSPFRQITKIGSYEDGDTDAGYTAHITFEQYSKDNSRFYRVEHIGTKTRSEEKLIIGTSVFTRLDVGVWKAENIPSRTKVVRVPDDRVNSPYIRKPGAEEILYYSLGERPNKGRVVSVYEEVTRHVLIRKADNSETHYENRTRFWLAEGKTVVRHDKYYAIFGPEKTTRMFTSHEWEVNADIKPFESPIKCSSSGRSFNMESPDSPAARGLDSDFLWETSVVSCRIGSISPAFHSTSGCLARSGLRFGPSRTAALASTYPLQPRSCGLPCNVDRPPQLSQSADFRCRQVHEEGIGFYGFRIITVGARSTPFVESIPS